MNKTGIKAFFCSFLLSMLTIFVADRVLSRSQKNNEDREIKISNNSIALFFKEEARIISSAKTQDVTKEELIKLADKSDIEDYSKLLSALPITNNNTLVISNKNVLTQNVSLLDSSLTYEETSTDNNTVSEDASDDYFAEDDFITNDNLSDDTFSEEIVDMNFTDNVENNILHNYANENTSQKEDEKFQIEDLTIEDTRTTNEKSDLKDKSQNKIALSDNMKEVNSSKGEENSPETYSNRIPLQWGDKPYDKTKTKISKNTSEITNKVAMTKEGIEINTLKTELASVDKNQKETPNNGTANNEKTDSPWVVATSRSDSSNFIPIKEQKNENKESEKKSYLTKVDESSSEDSHEGEEEQNSGGIPRNILIPIPEDIMEEGPVVPQLISSKRNKELQKKIEENVGIRRAQRGEDENHLHSGKSSSSNTNLNSDIAEEENEQTTSQKKKKTIFDSLTSIFSSDAPTIGTTTVDNDSDQAGTAYKKMFQKKKTEKKATKILPTEIKLSFQSNRAEISGPTLRWIEAFANKVNSEDDVVLEVRIDGTSAFDLQQKRLRLLHNILTNKGVDYQKINTVFTAREPNSFIIRAVKVDIKMIDKNNKGYNNMNKIYQSW